MESFLNQSEGRLAVPDPVKRQLRQESGFGCCKCGLPILDYHHIIPYSKEPHFRPEDMMVLCPNHHREAPAMAEEEQRGLKEHPINIQRGYAEGQLKVNQNYCAISMGSNEFIGNSCFVKVDGDNLLEMELSADNRLLLSLQLYDPQDNLLAIIHKNEWISGDPLPWDIESTFQRLKIRRKAGDIALEINTRSTPIAVRADLWRRKQNIRLNEAEIKVNGVIKEFRLINICFICKSLVINTKENKLGIQDDPRFGYKGSFIGWGDPVERLEMGKIEWLKMQGRYPEGL